MESKSAAPFDLPATSSSAPDYFSVLSSVIESSKGNPAQLRNLVYELARVNLKREIFVRHPLIRKAEVDQQMRELEDAIERVENASDDDRLTLTRQALSLERLSGAPIKPGAPASVRQAAATDRRALPVRSGDIDYDAPIKTHDGFRGDRMLWPGVRSALQLIGASIFGAVILAGLTGQFDLGRLRTPAPADLPADPVRDRFPDLPAAQSDGRGVSDGREADIVPEAAPFPLPTSYGVYAIRDGQLVELERLPMRVPDPRVFISPDIKEPSQIALPDGKPTFVVFRRDWPNGAPDKVAVRVVARVTHELTFKDGKAAVNDVANMWRIRGNSYELRVGPLGSNPDMVVIRPEDPLDLPAGRYALVLNGLGYDFTIAGRITDPAQCLEKTEAVGGGIYSECRSP